MAVPHEPCSSVHDDGTPSRRCPVSVVTCTILTPLHGTLGAYYGRAICYDSARRLCEWRMAMADVRQRWLSGRVVSTEGAKHHGQTDI